MVTAVLVEDLLCLDSEPSVKGFLIIHIGFPAW
jgi:hypothetical protein